MKTYFAIAGIVFIESLALANGINGVSLSLSVAALAGLGGYHLKGFSDSLRRKPPAYSPEQPHVTA